MKNIFIEILGTNNLGKTTQINLLKDYFEGKGLKVAILKYPKYDIPPTGLRINDFLRGGNPENLSPLDFQKLNVQNRQDFESDLKKLIAEHDYVLAEMYIGSSIAFGIGDGVAEDVMLELNKHLLPADVSILLDGERFMESKEVGHHFEEDEVKTRQVRQIHLDLAEEFDWPVVNANQSREEVMLDLLQHIEQPKGQ